VPHKATTKLCKFLHKTHQITVQDSKHFLDHIYADPNLPGLLQIATNLIEILPLLVEIAPADWNQEDLDSHISVCKKIISSSSELNSIIDGFDKPDKFGTGSLTKFPLYSSLWFMSPNFKMSTQYNYLQAHFINACNLYDEYSDNTNPPSDIKNASLSIRRIRVDTLKNLPQIPLSIEGFSSHLKEEREYSHEKSRLQIDRIKLVLEHTTGDKATQTRSIKKKGKRKLTASITKPNIDLEATIQLSPSIVVKHTNTEEKNAKESFKQGNAIEDSFTGPTHISDNEKRTPNSNNSKKAQAIKARNKSRSIATNNQNNPFKWERLNFHDVIRLFDAMDDVQNGLFNEIKLSKIDKYELISLINIMYWTSSTEKALAIKVSKSTNRATKVVSENDVYFCKDDSTWVLSLPTLEKRRQLSSAWEKYVESTKDYICLDAPYLAVKSLQKILINNTKGLNKKSRPLFKNTNKEKLITHLNKFLSVINKKFKTRLTAIRISTHLFQTLTNQLGDIADSSFITGNTPSLGQKAALYYYAPHQSFLQKSYTDTCNSISRVISTGLNWNEVTDLNVTYINLKRVGSRLCPLESTVTNLVSDLKANIKRYRNNKKNTSYIIDFHNAYTSYCVTLLGYFTGYRAVFDPFYSQTEIDLDSGFLVISDKDGNDYYNSRTVWLPDICIKQLEEYNNHRIAIMEKLTLLNPILSRQIKNKEQLNWTGKKVKNHTPFFFFLNEQLNYLAVSSKSLHNFVNWSYELPLNANRHYLRTKFREKSIPGEICDGLLGHWECGEPYGRFSTLSPNDFKNEIKKPLEDLCKKSNWTIVQGLQTQYSDYGQFEFLPKKNTIKKEKKEKEGGHKSRDSKRKCQQAKEREKQHGLVLDILMAEEPKLLEDINSLKIKDERIHELFEKIYQNCHGYTLLSGQMKTN